MIGPYISQPMASFNTLSRKELQALCKSNGIPANKTNAFMMEALATKRVPLSQVDSNRDQKVDRSIRSPPVVNKNSAVNSVGPAPKPPVFTNNFLRRGKRKDPPTSDEIEQEQLKVPRTNAASGIRKSSTHVLSRPGAVQGKDAQTVNATKEAKVTSSDNLTNLPKEKIEERVRSQIDAALSSVQIAKVKKVFERPPSAPTSLGSDSGEVINLPLENSEQQKEVEVFPLPDAPGTTQIPITQQNISTSTPALQRSTSVALVAASPPISFSPLVRRVEENVRSIVDRIQNFWKSRELTVVNSSCSPVQENRELA